MEQSSSSVGASPSDASDDSIEYVLLNKPECFVYNVPPSTTGRGHKAGEWTNCIWRGRLQVAAKGAVLVIKFVDANTGELFAACPIPPNTPIENVVQRTVDSSRYFVLRLSDGSGHHAYLGVGFEDRNDAFDFNACLYDFQRQRCLMGAGDPKAALKPGAGGQKDLINPLREKARQGEGKVTVRLKGLKPGPTAAPQMVPTPAETPNEEHAPANDDGFLPPPPVAGRSRHGAGLHRHRRTPGQGAPAQPVSTVNDLIDFDANVSIGSPEASQPSVQAYPGGPPGYPQVTPYCTPVPGYNPYQQGSMPYGPGYPGQRYPTQIPPYMGQYTTQGGYQGQYPPQYPIMQGVTPAQGGAQPGMPQGAQPGMPQGVQPGMPQGVQPGMPQGAQPGMAQGAQPGMAQGAQPGMAQGAQPGMAQGAQPGMAQVSPSEMVSPQVEQAQYVTESSQSNPPATSTEGTGSSDRIAQSQGVPTNETLSSHQDTTEKPTAAVTALEQTNADADQVTAGAVETNASAAEQKISGAESSKGKSDTEARLEETSPAHPSVEKADDGGADLNYSPQLPPE